MALDTVIISVVVFSIIMFVLYVKFRKIFKIFFWVNILIVILLTVSAVMVVLDAIEVKDALTGGAEVIYLMSQDGNLKTGLQMKGAIKQGNEPIFINDEEVVKLQDYYSKGDMDKILNNKFKLFIFKAKCFEDIPAIVLSENEGFAISKQSAVEIINSENPKDEMVDLILRFQFNHMGLNETQQEMVKEQLTLKIEKQLQDSEAIKGQMFAALVSNGMEDDGSVFLIDQYKKGNLIVYKETILFKVLKLIPREVIINALDN